MSHDLVEQDEPASVLIDTESKDKIDINNISGKRKARLVMEGEISIDNFLLPSNMPGKQLKELRDRHRSAFDSGIKRLTKDAPNTYQVGELVKYRESVSEVLEVDSNKGVKIRKREGGTKWVHHTKVEMV